ncbi:MAG TPA: SRPBCC family protein [Caulobacteraceae bacterium]
MTDNEMPRLVLERTLDAPLALVWHAWTDPAALARWWGPENFANPVCEFAARPGGAIRIDMLGPDGVVYPMDGRVEFIAPPTRLVFVSGALGPDGKRLFDVLSTLELAEEGGATRLRLDVRATAIHNPVAAGHLAGMEAGWTTSLERLASSFVQRKTVFGQFTLRRTIAASPARVFAAFATAEGKEAWFRATADQWSAVRRDMDFRVGGRERLVGRWRSGVVTDFDAVYQDIVPDRRVVYSYAMYVNAVRISVSLATIDIEANGHGCKLTVTEQGAFLDGYDDAGSRERGTSDLLDALVRSVTGEG